MCIFVLCTYMAILCRLKWIDITGQQLLPMLSLVSYKNRARPLLSTTTF